MREVQSSGLAGQNRQYSRDDAYYCENVVVLVENILFCLPKTILCQSSILASKLDLFLNDYGITSDAHPLPLEGCTRQEFRSFLRVVLPLRHDSDHVLTKDECLSTLKLSRMWDLPSLRTSSLRSLKFHANADPVLKLLIAVGFDMGEWLVPAVNSLAHRIEPLGHEDVDRLTTLIDTPTVMDLVLKVAQVREGFRGTRSLDTRPYSRPSDQRASGLSRQTYHTAYICDVFSCNLDGSPRSPISRTCEMISTPMHTHEVNVRVQNAGFSATSGPSRRNRAASSPGHALHALIYPIQLSAELCTPVPPSSLVMSTQPAARLPRIETLSLSDDRLSSLLGNNGDVPR